jgi:hypothetical protein
MTFLDNRPHAALETYQGASLTFEIRAHCVMHVFSYVQASATGSAL